MPRGSIGIPVAPAKRVPTKNILTTPDSGVVIALSKSPSTPKPDIVSLIASLQVASRQLTAIWR
jgi:hypothetical protein